MPQALSGLGSIFSAGSMGSKILDTGLLGMGTVSNILQQRRANSIYDQYIRNQRVLSDPAALASRVNALTVPLSTALKQSVGNAVQADMGARGLSDAPGIFASTLAQSLAPYAQKSQELALQGVLAPLGQQLPFGMGAELGRPADLSGLLQKLQSIYAKPSIGAAVGDLSDYKLPPTFNPNSPILNPTFSPQQVASWIGGN